MKYSQHQCEKKKGTQNILHDIRFTGGRRKTLEYRVNKHEH